VRRAATRKQPQAIALLGGAFDPIHVGHLAVARVALRRFHLDAVHFLPSGRPPHKPEEELSAFEHRYAMVALACAGEPRFVPSLAEADISGSGRFFYTIDTVRRYRRQLAGTETRLYFITGADAFLQIRTWKEYRALLDACDFIVAHRPGFGIDAVADVIPPELLAKPAPEAKRRKARRAAGEGSIALRRTSVHMLRTVSSNVSSTEIRQRRKQGQSIRGLVPARVADYIEKQALYCR
jgi:nicotinate-nucleotide adenylyltransferase